MNVLATLLSRHKRIKSYQIQHYLNQDKIFVSLKISFLFSWAEIIMDGETVGRWILEVGNRLFEEVGSTWCQMSKGCFFLMFRKWYAPDSRWEQLSIDSIGLYILYIYIYTVYIYNIHLHRWKVWDVRAVVVLCGDFPEHFFEVWFVGHSNPTAWPLCFRDHFQDYLHGSRRSAGSWKLPWHLSVVMMNI